MEQLLDGLYIKIKNQDIIDEIDNIYRFIDICWFIHVSSPFMIFLSATFLFRIFLLHLFIWILFLKMLVFLVGSKKNLYAFSWIRPTHNQAIFFLLK